MKKYYLIGIIFLASILGSYVAAQPVPGDDGDSPDSPCNFLPPELRPAECVPVDDWMYVLAGAGLVLVALQKKKIFN